MNKLELKRTCWWCGKRLMKISHAEVQTPGGHVVWVHKGCEQKTKAEFRVITAAPRAS